MVKHLLAGLQGINFGNEDFQAALAFLSREDLSSLPKGRYEITERVFASVQEYNTEPAEQVPWEAHERYCDVQYIVAGRERFYVVPKAALIPSGPFNEANDIGFFREANVHADELVLNPGDFAIVTTDEAHKPRCVDKESQFVKKVIVKVPQPQ